MSALLPTLGVPHFDPGGDVVVQLRPNGAWVAVKRLPPGVQPTPDAVMANDRLLTFQGAGSSLLIDQGMETAIDDWEMWSTAQPDPRIAVHLP
jgi:hypothetical protein